MLLKAVRHRRESRRWSYLTCRRSIGVLFFDTMVAVLLRRKGTSPVGSDGLGRLSRTIDADLIINLKSAKTIGRTVSPSLLSRAEEIIE